MAGWNVEIDDRKNRLYIDLTGTFTAAEARESNREILDAIDRMDAGFEVITDLDGFTPGEQDAVATIEEGKRAVKDAGAAAAVRVVPDSASATGQMHFERVGSDEEEYAVAVAESVEQAEKLLDSR